MVGRPGAARRAPLLVASLVMVLGFMAVLADPAAGQTSQATMSIFDDDGEKAMFPHLDMAPGREYQECILVGTTGAEPADRVLLGVADATGALAAHLHLRLEAGRGGHYGDCSGFVGTEVYRGTLDQLALTGAGHGIDTGWSPATARRLSFRITAWLDPSFSHQGLAASGRFVWTMQSDRAPVPGGTSSRDTSSRGTPTAGTSPAPVPSGGPPTQTRAGAPAAATPSGSAGVPGSSVGGGVGAGEAPAGAPAAVERPPDLSLRADLGRIAAALGRARVAVMAVITSPQYPIAAIMLALGFLLVQDMIDRRDPKLSGVNRVRDNDVDFPDRFGVGGIRA